MHFDLQHFRLIAFFGVLFVIWIVESRFSVRSWQMSRRYRWKFHIEITIVNTVITRLLCTTPLILWLHFVREQGWGLSHVFGLTGASEVLFTILIFDCLIYWWHRFNHVVPFLWRFHRYHHMDTHVDVTTSLRFHPGELVLSHLAKAVWILVWGPSFAGFVVFEALTTAYSMFHHSNIDFPNPVEKLIRYIHMTPRVHASHHTVTLRSRNANYSTIFLAWDYLFRTFREPDYAEMEQLGIPEGRKGFLTWKAYLTSAFKRIE